MMTGQAAAEGRVRKKDMINHTEIDVSISTEAKAGAHNAGKM